MDQNGHNTKILIADDDPTIRSLLQSALIRMGYKLEISSNGDDAWTILQQRDAPEMAILDWVMPGMTGVEICRRLRGRKDAPYIYVVLLSGMDTLTDLVAGLEAGADDYMTKPFKPAELKARLRSGRRILDLQRELLTAQSQLTILANHDSLTTLWNRRVIMEKLDQEVARAQREITPVGAILIDIDHFKRINDSLGHTAGDEILRQVAARMAEAVRPEDSVGRYGGEEFLIVAPNCGMREAFEVAERVRSVIGETPIVCADESITVTASLGASAIVDGQASSAQELIGAADRALYRAKEFGRNRVEWHFPKYDAVVELR
jgi:diguanylate cyclase (GGDEF)-like protein